MSARTLCDARPRRRLGALLLALLLSACGEDATRSGTPAGPADAGTPQAVDLVLHGGSIHTAVEGAQRASTLVVDEGRVLAVGDDALRKRYRGDREIDLGGAFLMPGFNDSHSHIQSYARRYIALQDVRSIEELKARVRAKAAEVGPGAWITGYGWSEDDLAEGRRPLRQDLDEAAPENPVLLTRAGGHSAVASSLALEEVGFDRDTPDPDGGVIERDEQGELNGIVRERHDLIEALIPEPTESEVRESLIASLRALLPLGITSVTQASDQIERWPIWRAIYTDEGLTLPRARVQLHWRGTEAMTAFLEEAGDDDARLRIGPIKIFADGGFTGPAAYTKAPYRGEESYRGYLNMSEEELRDLIAEVHGAGWQLGIHAIGDAAIEITVDHLAAAIASAPRPDHRHYLNHFSMRPDDATMEQMAEHAIAITQQPNFTYTLAGRYSTYLDGWRLEHNNPIRSPMDHGVRVALSSDILPIGPMVGLYAAVTRKGRDGRVYGADEAISLDEALRAYTAGGAWLSFEEDLKGTLEPGRLADFIVLESDPFAIPPEALLDLAVMETWVEGRRLFVRDPGAAADTP